MKDHLGQSFDFEKPAPIDIKHSTLDKVYKMIWVVNYAQGYACVQAHVRGRVTHSSVKCTIYEGGKGREGRKIQEKK
jgi:hypothetical protein